jgi:hypothetical protein
VIFIHGLGHEHLDDWFSSGTPREHWPLWLVDDLPDVAIWTFKYEAAQTRWRGNSMSFTDRADNLLALLRSRDEFQSGEISFVAYSYGGLVSKQILRSAEAKAAQDAAVAKILRNVRRICFLGTPHFGADLATLGNLLRFAIRPSLSAIDLVRNGPYLRNLNLWYRSFSASNGIASLNLVEAQRTWLGHIVKPDSADPGLPSDPIFVDANHNSIASPRSRDSEIYIHIRNFLLCPIPNGHRDSLVADALQNLEATEAARFKSVDNKLDRVLAGANFSAGITTLSSSSTIIDAELDKRLWTIRKARFFHGYDVLYQVSLIRTRAPIGAVRWT